jgi:hypothetical protein
MSEEWGTTRTPGMGLFYVVGDNIGTMGTTQSVPLAGGDVCSDHGTNKKACRRDARCRRSHKKCVRSSTSYDIEYETGEPYTGVKRSQLFEHRTGTATAPYSVGSTVWVQHAGQRKMATVRRAHTASACRHLSKTACQEHPLCHRSHKTCVEGAAPTGPCRHLSKKACRQHPSCRRSDKTCIRKNPARMRQGYYSNQRVNIVRDSDVYPGHYVIEFMEDVPYQATVPWSTVTSSPTTTPTAVGYTVPSDMELLERMVNQLERYRVSDEADYRPSCVPGTTGNWQCQQMGFQACGSHKHPFRCNPEAVIRRWKTATATKCQERCAAQPERTVQQADMKQRCYRNCRSRAQ